MMCSVFVGLTVHAACLVLYLFPHFILGMYVCDRVIVLSIVSGAD